MTAKLEGKSTRFLPFNLVTTSRRAIRQTPTTDSVGDLGWLLLFPGR